MAKDAFNSVRMIGPKGKISFVSRKASQSVHLANIGFRPMNDVMPSKPATKPKEDAGQA